MANISVYAENIGKLDERVARFARKYKGVPFTYIKGEPRFVEIVDPDTRDRRWQEIVDVEIDATYKINGWQFVAALDYDHAQGANIIRRNPSIDAEVPQEYYSRCACDHCNRRVGRVHTTLMRNDAGEYKQVGNTCVKDFIGIDLSHFSIALRLQEEVDEIIRMGSSVRYYPVAEVIEQSIVWVGKHGYVSRAKSNAEGMPSTGDILLQLFFDGKTAKVSDEVKDRAAAIIAYWCDIEAKSEYEHNAQLFAGKKAVKAHEIGFVASMVVGYQKAMKKAEKAAKMAEEAKSAWVGDVGDKLTMDCTITCKTCLDTQFGYMYVYEIIDADGNVFVWKTSKDIMHNIRKVIHAAISGTIKAHTEFRGVQQTELTRVKIVRDHDAIKLLADAKEDAAVSSDNLGEEENNEVVEAFNKMMAFLDSGEWQD